MLGPGAGFRGRLSVVPCWLGDMQEHAIADLDTGDTLTGVEVAVLARRAAERSLLHHAAHWAALHGDHEGVTLGHGSTDGEDDPRRQPPAYTPFRAHGTPPA